jgi:probable H4MPT-linked C1 transfer pathway protein
MSLLALDIGGANLKAADGVGFGFSRYFPLWREPQNLAAAIVALLDESPPAERVVVTMTGELADCFRTKTEGVHAIIDAVIAAAGKRDVRVYLTVGSFVPPEVARVRAIEAAASNWHALATFVGRWIERSSALLVDIGSTTTDIVPIVNGEVASTGLTDPTRIAASELVYTGVVRSPICAVTPTIPWGGAMCRTAHELFATTWDAYLVTGDLPEEPASTHTADGRPATVEFARERLARAICADSSMFDEDDARRAAATVAEEQLALVSEAVTTVIGSMTVHPSVIVVSGQGEFLARRAAERVLPGAEIVSLGRRLGELLSRAAPAHALAVLAS